MRFILCFFIVFFCLPAPSYAVELGRCRVTKERYARHLYFTLQGGKKVLKDAKKYHATKALLASEKRLHALEKQMHALTKKQLQNCQLAKKSLKEALAQAQKTVATLKKEYAKIVKEAKRLQAALVKQVALTNKYKKQRVTWALRIGGILVAVAGGLMIGIEAYEAGRTPNRAVSPTMMTAGVGTATVGVGAVVLSFVID